MRTVPTYRSGRDYYSESGDRGGLAGCFSLLLVCVFLCIPPALVWLTEVGHFETVSSFSHLIKSIHELSQNSRKDDVVHLHGSVNPSSAAVLDHDMGVEVADALKMRRITEYCQWQEMRSTSCETCTRQVEAKDGSRRTETYDCNCITHFDYVKTWRRYRISSMMFDQPGAHTNPGRDPMPSVTFAAPQAEILSDHHSQSVLVDSTILTNTRATWRRVEWNLHGVAPRRGWWSPYRWGWWKDDTTRYEGIHLLRDTNMSLAARNDNFVYVGDGFFFSPYQASRMDQLLKYFVEYVEGSLFDWQLGDLMPSCTAGDIRFHYQIMDPTVVSVIGQVMDGSEKTVQLGAISTPTKPVGMIHQGPKDVHEMFRDEERDSWWQAMLPRVLLVPWSAAMANLLLAFLGRRMHGLNTVAGAASVWFGFMGGLWWNLWGKTTENLVCVVFAAVLFVWTVGSSGPRATGGPRAIWCMLGRWAQVPPSWRVEESYEDGGGGEYETKKYQ